ncbi:TlpA family protein disulfide reductase [Streptomyces sp. TRM76130]|nr:TlpA family protein disulfide reductase [Streptomyces sp. TRM76130]
MPHLSAGQRSLKSPERVGTGYGFSKPWQAFLVDHSRIVRTLLTVTLAAAGAFSLDACGYIGTEAASQAKYTTGADGIATAPKGDREATNGIEGETLQGEQLNVESEQGKIVVINVWGSWCAPCREETPFLVKVAKEMEGEGVNFIGVNTRDTRSRATAFEQDHGVTYPSLFDPTGKVILYGFPEGIVNPQTVPTTVVLDREGRIAARAFGALSDGELHAMIDPLLAEK